MLSLEFQQLQSCISSLFGIPSIHMLQNPSTNCDNLIALTLEYGHKLIQITERLDEFHQRTASVHETKTYQHILDLYNECGFKDEGNESETHMLEQIRTQLKRSIQSVGRSRQSSKTSGKKTKREVQFSKKEMSMIREEFRQEEHLWRQVYVKMEMISEKYCQEQKFTQNSVVLHKEEESLSGTIRNNVSMAKSNLANLSQFLDSLTCSLPQIKNSKFNQLINEIEERENVFSYSMSKLLESFRALKNPTNKNTNSEQIHDNITSLISKLFDIYPSSGLLRSLELKEEPINIREYLANSKEVQCNIKVDTKKDGQIKNLSLTFYRFRCRVQQTCRKIESGLKLKKQVEPKELERLAEELKEAVVYNEQLDYDEIRLFQEQVESIATNYERRETQFKEELQKNFKKANKSLTAYEQELKGLKTEINLLEEKNQKMSKKIEAEKAERQKMKDKVGELENIREHLQSEVEKTKSALKQEHKEQLKEQKLMKAEYDLVLKEKRNNEHEHQGLVEKLKLQEKLMEDERASYICKVKMMENKLQKESKQTKETKHCLELMIEDNKLLKDNLEEFTQVHEEKIHECEQIAAEFGELEKQMMQRELEVKEHRINAQAQKTLMVSLEQELREKTQQLEVVGIEKDQAVLQSSRYKELGRLNQSDIEALKEEFEKVQDEYTRVEQENQFLKSHLEEVTIDHAKAVDIQQRSNALIAERDTETRQLKRQLSDLQEHNKFLLEESNIKDNQLQQLASTTEVSKEEKKESSKLKKDINEVRNALATSELQYNVAKQELQNIRQEIETKKHLQKSEAKSLSSKHQLQLDSLKIQLKNRKETWERERANFQRERQLSLQKIQQLGELLSEKEALTSRMRALGS